MAFWKGIAGSLKVRSGHIVKFEPLNELLLWTAKAGLSLNLERAINQHAL